MYEITSRATKRHKLCDSVDDGGAATIATLFSPFDMLPCEMLQIILLRECCGYLPALREVCTAWRDMVADHSKKNQRRKKDIGIIPVHTLAVRGHTDLLQHIRESPSWTGVTSLCMFYRSLSIMENAARGGHTELLCLCWSWHQQQDRMNAAAFHRYRCLLLNTEQGEIVVAAAAGGHESTLRSCKEELGVCDFNRAMVDAALHGHESIVRLCVEWGADRVNIAMEEAAHGGHESIVRLCYEQYGADDLGPAIIAATTYGFESIVRLILEWGYTRVNDVMEQAAFTGHASIVRLCKEWGAVDFNTAMIAAADGGYDDIVNLCREWGATQEIL